MYINLEHKVFKEVIQPWLDLIIAHIIVTQFEKNIDTVGMRI